MDKETVIYSKESYAIVGAAYDVFNVLGYGFKESLYQKAFAEELRNRGLSFEKEKTLQIQYKDVLLGSYRFDFVVNGIIVVELKTRHSLGYAHIKQVVGYLKTGNYKLAILIYFTKDGVKFRRVLNA